MAKTSKSKKPTEITESNLDNRNETTGKSPMMPDLSETPEDMGPTDPQGPTPQTIETENYGMTYKIKPEFRTELLKLIKQYPFNQIAGLLNAVSVPTMDEQTLNQIMNVIGQFPFEVISPFIEKVNQYIEPILEN